MVATCGLIRRYRNRLIDRAGLRFAQSRAGSRISETYGRFRELIFRGTAGTAVGFGSAGGRREDIERIAEAVRPFGLEYRHLAGVDMLVSRESPSAKRAIHLVFAGEKVRPEYVASAPPVEGGKKLQGIPLIPLSELIKMKLTSFRLKDQMHLKDLDEAASLLQKSTRILLHSCVSDFS